MSKNSMRIISGLKRTMLFIILLAVLISGCSFREGSEEFDSIIDRITDFIGLNRENQTNHTIPNVAATGSAQSVTKSVTESEQILTATPEPTPAVYTIQLWVPPQFDTEQDTPAGKALTEAIQSYTKEHSNVTISVRVKATIGDSNMVNTIYAANHVAKPVVPTLALMSRGDMETSFQRNLLQPMNTSVFSDSGSWYNYARQSSVVDNSVYGIPVFGDGLVLTYRISKIGAELGDWQDILGRGLPIGFAPYSSSSLFGTFMYLSMGGKLINDQGQPYLDQQKLTDALNFFLNGGKNGSFPPSIAQLSDQSQVWQRFNDGTFPMIVTNYSSFRHYLSPEISAVSLPLQEGVSNYPLVNTWNMVMLETDPLVQAEALKFVEYLCNESINPELAFSAGYLPVRVSNGELWQENTENTIVKTISENGSLVPNNNVANKIYMIINNAVTQVIKNLMTPEDAARDAITSLN